MCDEVKIEMRSKDGTMSSESVPTAEKARETVPTARLSHARQFLSQSSASLGSSQTLPRKLTRLASVGDVTGSLDRGGVTASQLRGLSDTYQQLLATATSQVARLTREKGQLEHRQEVEDYFMKATILSRKILCML